MSMKKESHIVTAPVKSQTTIIMNPRFQLSTLSRTNIENVGQIKYIKCSMFQRHKNRHLNFKNWDPVNIKTESEWRSRAKKIMTANVLFCIIVLIALIFEYHAYINRNEQKLKLLETVKHFREEIHHIQDEAVHGHTHD